jgi:hypothetical protein
MKGEDSEEKNVDEPVENSNKWQASSFVED